MPHTKHSKAQAIQRLLQMITVLGINWHTDLVLGYRNGLVMAMYLQTNNDVRPLPSQPVQRDDAKVENGGGTEENVCGGPKPAQVEIQWPHVVVQQVKQSQRHYEKPDKEIGSCQRGQQEIGECSHSLQTF